MRNRYFIIILKRPYTYQKDWNLIARNTHLLLYFFCYSPFMSHSQWSTEDSLRKALHQQKEDFVHKNHNSSNRHKQE